MCARIEILLDTVEVIDDNAQYEIFGLSFEYSENMIIGLIGLQESEAARAPEITQRTKYVQHLRKI